MAGDSGVFEKKGGSSEGDLGRRFKVNGKVAGNVRIVWNHHAKIQSKRRAEILLEIIEEHVTSILEHYARLQASGLDREVKDETS